LFTISGECIFDIQSKAVVLNNEIVEGECTIPGNFLNDGSYYFSLYFVKDTSSELYAYNECLMFEVADFRENNNWYDKWWGFVRPNFPLTMKRNSDILLNLKQTELF
jgi:lipopolysaccharide transport system ATP-binding protein